MPRKEACHGEELKISIVDASHSLRSEELPCQRIARRLGIHRGTVTQYLLLGQQPISKRASALIFQIGTSGAVARFLASRPAPLSFRQAKGAPLPPDGESLGFNARVAKVDFDTGTPVLGADGRRRGGEEDRRDGADLLPLEERFGGLRID